MKKIYIFLASSIVELQNERAQIENFIRKISDDFEEHYNVKIQPILCENLEDAYSTIGKQNEYNEKIRNSDFCFFIFFTKAGEYTQGEFDVARKKFEETGKPKIYTFFKIVEDGLAEQSLYDFMEKLEKNFGHYPGRFEHIDTVKLRILQCLKLQEMDMIDLTVENNCCFVDGKKTLSLNNVSEFANNRILKELKSELSEIEQQYFALKAKHNDIIDLATDRKYAEVATKRQNLLDEIEELEKNIFNLSLRLYRDDARGEITQRQKQAYELFEKGDIEGANRILDYGEIKSEYQRRKEIRRSEQKKEARIYIRETRTKIEMLTQLVRDPKRFNEIEKLYDDITEEAFEMCIELDVIYDCISFLHDKNKGKKAIELALRLSEVYKHTANVEKSYKAALFNLLGILFNDNNDPEKAEDFYLKAIDIYEKLTADYPEKFNPDLATSYNNAGVFYADQNIPEKAEGLYLKAIDIYEKLAADYPDKFNPGLAGSYNNAGVFYADQNVPQKAEDFYLKSIDIREKLAGDYPEKFNSDLAMSYNNAGVFYADQNDPEKAEELFLKSIDIREKLSGDYPEKFNPDLAVSYNNAGKFYADQNEFEKAEGFYLKAIDIREKLAADYPEKFNPDLAVSYNNAGNFYADQNNSKKAEDFHLKAIDIYEKLAGDYLEKFNPDLAGSFNDAGNFYADQNDPEKAEDFYLKAIDIYEKLAGDYPEKFNSDLATSYNNAGAFYADQNATEKAEEFYLKSIDIREKLAADYPEKFNPDLAGSCNNAGKFYAAQNAPEKAEDFFLKAIDIYEKLAGDYPEKFNPNLVASYNDAGVFFAEQNVPQRAEDFYLKAIDIGEKFVSDYPKKIIPNLAISCINYAFLKDDNTLFLKAFNLAKKCPDDPYCRKIIELLS